LHFLAYCFDTSNSLIKRFFAKQCSRRKKEILLITKKLQTLGFPNIYDTTIKMEASYLGLFHIIEVLLNDKKSRNKIRKEVGSLEIFPIINYYFAKGRPLYVKEEFPSAETTFPIFKRAGAIISLAHPGFHLSFSEDPSIKKLTTMGLNALEVFTPKHNWQQTIHYQVLAKKLNLIITAGSDFHSFKHEHYIPLASPIGYLKTPKKVYDNFIKYINKNTSCKIS